MSKKLRVWAIEYEVATLAEASLQCRKQRKDDAGSQRQ